MNQFRTCEIIGGICKLLAISIVLIIPPEIAFGRQAWEKTCTGNPLSAPCLDDGKFIYADIDTIRQRIFVLTKKELWQYRLKTKRWAFLGSLDSIPEKFSDLEFGYNHQLEKLQMWSRGIGRVYEISLNPFTVSRVDQSYPHKNQFGHQPFFYKGQLYAFGGYGYWQWKNILTFYNREIKEWNLYDVSPSAPVPEVRVSKTGIYVASVQEFYIYGGESPMDGKPDSPSTERMQKRDIWKFSFKHSAWEKQLSLPETNLKFYPATGSGKVGKTNKISRSFYSSTSGIWYLPMVPEDRTDDKFYITPVELGSGIVYSSIDITFGQSKDFLPTSFLYDEKTQTVFIVGIDFLSNTNRYPVRIISMSEDTLLTKLSSARAFISRAYLYLTLGIILAGLILGTFLWKKKTIVQRKSLSLPLDQSDLKQLEWLNNQEKVLIEKLLTFSRPMESQELEELVWPDIHSFDYRRKLRNEIIRSINQKFKSRYPDQGQVIIRKRAPNDNRRYTYGLNKSLAKSEERKSDIPLK